jgi:Ca2+-binding RTX toxin-like protein
MTVLVRDLRAGRLQTIEGRVVRRVDEDDFVLRDRTGRILVEVDLDDRALPVRAGQRLKVVGWLDRDDFDFDAQRVTRPNSSVIYDRFRNRTANNQNNGSDRLLGGVGEAVIVGDIGTDTLLVRTGEDRFVYRTMQEGRDRILNFSTTEDVIDLRPLFARSEYTSAQPVADYLRFNQVGAHTQIQIDPDGSAGGQRFKTFVTLNDISVDTLTSQNVLI